MSDTILFKRGLEADLPSEAPEGEPHFCTDTGNLYIGQGIGKPLLLIGGSDVDLIKLSEYDKLISRDKYQIYKAKDPNNKIIGLYREVAVKFNSTTNTISISKNGIHGDYLDSVVFNSTNFPNLITGSKIDRIMVLPWSRRVTSAHTTAQLAGHWRLVVITEEGQVYHNFPKRSSEEDVDGGEQTGDIIKFEESVIWDMPERKFPSKDVNATGSEIYFPCLPSDCYTYRPALNTSSYGNGGFGKSITKEGKVFPRFYRPKMTWWHNSMLSMSGYEPDSKLTLIGTYKSNTGTGKGARICLFATSDGGRSWYCKYEFGDNGSDTNWVNDIDTTAIVGNYNAGSFVVKKRVNVYPNEVTKEPTNKFSYGTAIEVSSITKANPAVVTTTTAHGLLTGNIVVFQDNPGSAATSTDWNWMRNDTADINSGGNGIMFKVEKVTDTTFKLHEYVHSAFNNLPCRHIHYINRVKDGWIWGTGERYPAGWIFYSKMVGADSYYTHFAWQDFPATRLTSTDKSMERLLGGILLDDPQGTFIGAMDNESTPRNPVPMPSGRTEQLTRNSAGLFKGVLADIDDMGKFVPIYESKQVAYFFKEKGGAWIFIGQLGELAISFDKGETWHTEDIGTLNPVEWGWSTQHFFGESNKIIAINHFIIAIK